MELWLHTDEHEEAVSALEFVLESASKVATDIYRWRWIIISLHSALQGFMVIALRHTDGSGPVPDDIITRILVAQRTKEPQPREMLHKFLVLYRKLRSSRMDRFVHSRRFQPHGTQNRSVCRLNQLRNEFIHFTPKGWSLDVSSLPHICLDCLSVIHFLESQSGNIVWYNNTLHQRASNALTTAIAFFKALRDEYDRAGANEIIPFEPSAHSKII
jgi:hypothetical protein